MREGEVLRPILVAGYGRSGTTAIMNLLATAPEVALDREYPYEYRYLSYYAKLSSILSDRCPDERFTSDDLYSFEGSNFGPLPWHGHTGGQDVDWLSLFWDAFSYSTKKKNPMAAFYAEKAPVWLTSLVRPIVPSYVIHLFRDPRDVYLSSNAFMKARSYYGFHRNSGDTDLDHARILGLEYLNYFENFASDSQQYAEWFFLRYEDFVGDPEALAAWLRTAGVTPDVSRARDYFEGHRTSGSLAASVRRWQSENIPTEVCSFFERHLGREMKALGYPVNASDFCPSIEFRAEQTVPELSNPAHGRVELNDNATTIHIEGPDFGLLLPFGPIEAEDVKEVWVLVAGDVGDHFSLYWRDTDSGFSEVRSIHVKYVPGIHWRVVRFKAFEHPLWEGTIRQLRIDLFNGPSPQTRGVGKVRWVRLIN